MQLSVNKRDNLEMCLTQFCGVLVVLILSSFAFAADSDVKPRPAPDFTLPSEGGGRSGENIKLSELKGQVVLVNFWASWCGPCRKEMPLLEELYVKYKDLGVVFLGINVESESEKALKFLQTTPVSFPILMDKANSVTELYEVDAMPTTVIIDRDGQIRTHHRGYRDGYEDLYEADIKKLAREL